MKTDHYISELLYQHDCVIIPDFGGFVANYQPAKIHPVQHVFSPPSKKMAFNKNLQNNDGLLANRISLKENISYDEAARNIKLYAETLKKTLFENKMVKIEKVGVLRIDIEHNIQFEQDKTVNYLPDSFGLTDIQSLPVKRENFQKKTEKKFNEYPAIKPYKLSWVKRNKWKIAVAVPFSALIFTGSLYLSLFLKPDVNSVKTKSAEQSNDNATSVAFVVPSVIPEEKKIITSSVTQNDSIENNQPEQITVHAAQTENTAVISQKNIEMEKQYFIIGGCFSINTNAENFVKELQAKGYSAAVIGQTRTGLNMVSYNGFEEKEKAVVELIKIQAEENKEAWLYRREE